MASSESSAAQVPAASTLQAAAHHRLDRPKRIALVLLSAELAVLLVTGVWLYFVYRPSRNQAWSALALGDAGPASVSDVLRLIHGLTSTLTVLTAIVAGVLVAVASSRTGRGTGWALGGGLAIATVAASFTGALLPWDQLALWAVILGSNLDGFEILFDDRVRFVLIGNVEVGTATLVRWLLVHTLVLSPAVVALAVAAWRRSSGPIVDRGPKGDPHALLGE